MKWQHARCALPARTMAFYTVCVYHNTHRTISPRVHLSSCTKARTDALGQVQHLQGKVASIHTDMTQTSFIHVEHYFETELHTSTLSQHGSMVGCTVPGNCAADELNAFSLCSGKSWRASGARRSAVPGQQALLQPASGEQAQAQGALCTCSCAAQAV